MTNGSTPDLSELLPEVWALIRGPKPDVLYHYTSPSALTNIVEERSVWATNIAYLSDAREYLYALGIFMDRVQAHRSQRADDSLFAFLEALESECREPTLTPLAYVFSLSEDGNDLSQWRAYTPPTGGYSVGFSSDHLEDIISWDDPDWRLLPCVYERAAQDVLVDEAIGYTIRRYSSVATGPDDVVAASDNVRMFQGFIGTIAPALKDPAFRSEREWRLVNSADSDGPELERIRTRAGSYSLVPYVEIELSREHTDYELLGEDRGEGEPLGIGLRRVWVGPTPHPELSLGAAKLLVQSAGLPECEMEASQIPFRDF